MALRIALGPEGQLELSLPGGGKTHLRVEGHTGWIIRRQLEQQRKDEVLALARLVPEERPEPVVVPKRSPRISGRKPYEFSLEELDL